MRVPATKFHEVIAARRIGLTGNRPGTTARDISITEFVDVFHQ
jgi:hypothetical protein